MVCTNPYRNLNKASILADLWEFFVEAFHICSNGVMPNVKLVQALQKLHLTQPIYFTQQSISSWAPDSGGKIRMMCSHYRSLLLSETCQRRCMLQALGYFNRQGTFMSLGSVLHSIGSQIYTQEGSMRYREDNMHIGRQYTYRITDTHT